MLGCRTSSNQQPRAPVTFAFSTRLNPTERSEQDRHADSQVSRCKLRDAMPKSGVLRGARQNRRSAERVTLPNVVEGQIEEICRDMAVQVKRMRQLQDQADELRTTIRE